MPITAAKAQKVVADGSKSQPKVVGDFRRILDDKAVDVFVCAACNHWHAISAILACQAGKHVYSEKPAATSKRERKVVPQEEWITARKALLQKEKEASIYYNAAEPYFLKY